ncbi:hypothetical protein HJG60_010452 [Phyllostomus discolor]|uniref:Uncharacterized protein n=1 Tax=Phyllostomus discolor TaxID=89673 RepID=A0A834AGU7_9CHIR|nr:hypothetical protein HJG60_010452 [Phyllostomus discolor]
MDYKGPRTGQQGEPYAGVALPRVARTPWPRGREVLGDAAEEDSAWVQASPCAQGICVAPENSSDRKVARRPLWSRATCHWAVRLCAAGGWCGKRPRKHSDRKRTGAQRVAETLLLVADIFCWSFLFGESESWTRGGSGDQHLCHCDPSVRTLFLCQRLQSLLTLGRAERPGWEWRKSRLQGSPWGGREESGNSGCF